MKTFVSYAVFVCISISTTSISGQEIFYVKPGGSGDGSAWLNAMGDLQQAIDSCSEDDQIWISEGVYYPSRVNPVLRGGAQSMTFYISKNIRIYGGFAGMETDLSERSLVEHRTTLSGDIGIPDYPLDNTYNLIYLDATTANGPITELCVLDGLHLDSSRIGIRTLAEGPGVTCSPLLSNCYFSHHELAFLAVLNGGCAKLLDCNFEFNRGCISSTSDSIESKFILQRCDVMNNDYGLIMSKDSIYMDSCIFENSAHAGGAAFNGGGHAYLSNCIFVNNDASVDFQDGGAIDYDVVSDSASLQIFNCSFIGNRARAAGAIFLRVGPGGPALDFVLANCDFNNNSARLSAGVFRCVLMSTGGHLRGEVVNCTFSNNFTDLGHEMISGVSNLFDDLSLQFTNSILWNDNYPEISLQGSRVKFTNSIIQDTLSLCSSCSYGFINGGNNSTMDPLLIASQAGNARLAQGSPAIDAGVNDSLPANMLADLDGLPRSRGVVDIGAYENPYTGCQDSLRLNNLYSPLQGDYQATTFISLENGAFVSHNHLATLNAPEVILLSEVTSEMGSQLTINNLGCN